MTDETKNTEQSSVAADCPNGRLVMRFRPIRYVVQEVELWAVEDNEGYIDKYCSNKIEAIERCVELNA